MKTKKDILQSIARTNKEIADAMDNLATETDLINTGTEPEFPEKLVSVGGLYSVYDQPNGIPTLNGSGLINSDQLPSYVDDAIEGYYYNGAFYSDSSHQYEIVPESGKIYIDITDPDHAQSYRWTGSAYSIIADPREALFDVIFTEPVPGNLNSDKTLAEIEEAVNDGKVVRGFFGNITYYLTSIQHDTNVKFNAAIKNINYNIEGKYINSAWNWSYNSWDLSNIKPDWNATAGANNEILNKPSIPDTLDDLAVDATFTINGVTQTVTCDKTFSEMGNTPYIAIVLNYAGGVTYNLKCIASKSSDLINTITTPMLQSQGGTYEFNFLYSNNNWSVTFIAPSDFQLQSDWNQTNTNAKDYIKNKPTIPAAQIQSDWIQSDNTSADFIKNKPNISSIENNITSLQGNVDDLNNCEFPSGWRTPTKDEWNYLINTRSTSTVSGVSNAKYTKAQVNSINGLILIPDIFTLPSGITMTNINASSAAFDGNTYTTSQWEILENVGCIFLPAAGKREGTSILYGSVGSKGGYWSSSLNGVNAVLLNFQTNMVYKSQQDASSGWSVRLIKDNDTEGLFSISANTKCDFAKSNLQFHCLNKEWRFAANSYDIIGSNNSHIAENYNGWIDLFGFGTSGWNSGATCYQPWSTSMNNADYINHDLTGDYVNADWGVYNIKKQLHQVAFSGDYNDLGNKPIPIPTVADEGKMLQVNASGQYELVTIVNSELQPY